MDKQRGLFEGWLGYDDTVRKQKADLASAFLSYLPDDVPTAFIGAEQHANRGGALQAYDSYYAMSEGDRRSDAGKELAGQLKAYIGQREAQESADEPYQPKSVDNYWANYGSKSDVQAKRLGFIGSVITPFATGMADFGGAMFKGIDPFVKGDQKRATAIGEWLQNVPSEQAMADSQLMQSMPMWISDPDKPWTEEIKDLPEVINGWAARASANAALMVYGAIGGAVGAVVAGQAGPQAATGEEMVTAPVLGAIGAFMSKWVGGTVPMVAIEASGFMERAQEEFGIDKDIAEKYARYYGLLSGSIEGIQQMAYLKDIAGEKKAGVKFATYMAKKQANIYKKIALAMGDSAWEGGEEVSQGMLMGRYLKQAIAEQKLRDPEWVEKKEYNGYTLDEAKTDFAMGAVLGGIYKMNGMAANMVKNHASADAVQQSNLTIGALNETYAVREKDLNVLGKNVRAAVTSTDQNEKSLFGGGDKKGQLTHKGTDKRDKKGNAIFAEVLKMVQEDEATATTQEDQDAIDRKVGKYLAEAWGFIEVSEEDYADYDKLDAGFKAGTIKGRRGITDDGSLSTSYHMTAEFTKKRENGAFELADHYDLSMEVENFNTLADDAIDLTPEQINDDEYMNAWLSKRADRPDGEIKAMTGMIRSALKAGLIKDIKRMGLVYTYMTEEEAIKARYGITLNSKENSRDRVLEDGTTVKEFPVQAQAAVLGNETTDARLMLSSHAGIRDLKEDLIETMTRVDLIANNRAKAVALGNTERVEALDHLEKVSQEYIKDIKDQLKSLVSETDQRSVSVADIKSHGKEGNGMSSKYPATQTGVLRDRMEQVRKALVETQKAKDSDANTTEMVLGYLNIATKLMNGEITHNDAVTVTEALIAAEDKLGTASPATMFAHLDSLDALELLSKLLADSYTQDKSVSRTMFSMIDITPELQQALEAVAGEEMTALLQYGSLENAPAGTMKITQRKKADATETKTEAKPEVKDDAKKAETPETKADTDTKKETKAEPKKESKTESKPDQVLTGEDLDSYGTNESDWLDSEGNGIPAGKTYRGVTKDAVVIKDGKLILTSSRDDMFGNRLGEVAGISLSDDSKHARDYAIKEHNQWADSQLEDERDEIDLEDVDKALPVVIVLNNDAVKREQKKAAKLQEGQESSRENLNGETRLSFDSVGETIEFAEGEYTLHYLPLDENDISSLGLYDAEAHQSAIDYAKKRKAKRAKATESTTDTGVPLEQMNEQETQETEDQEVRDELGNIISFSLKKMDSKDMPASEKELIRKQNKGVTIGVRKRLDALKKQLSNYGQLTGYRYLRALEMMEDSTEDGSLLTTDDLLDFLAPLKGRHPDNEAVLGIAQNEMREDLAAFLDEADLRALNTYIEYLEEKRLVIMKNESKLRQLKKKGSKKAQTALEGTIKADTLAYEKMLREISSNASLKLEETTKAASIGITDEVIAKEWDKLPADTRIAVLEMYGDSINTVENKDQIALDFMDVVDVVKAGGTLDPKGLKQIGELIDLEALAGENSTIKLKEGVEIGMSDKDVIATYDSLPATTRRTLTAAILSAGLGPDTVNLSRSANSVMGELASFFAQSADDIDKNYNSQTNDSGTVVTKKDQAEGRERAKEDRNHQKLEDRIAQQEEDGYDYKSPTEVPLAKNITFIAVLEQATQRGVSDLLNKVMPDANIKMVNQSGQLGKATFVDTKGDTYLRGDTKIVNETVRMVEKDSKGRNLPKIAPATLALAVTDSVDAVIVFIESHKWGTHSNNVGLGIAQLARTGIVPATPYGTQNLGMNNWDLIGQNATKESETYRSVLPIDLSTQTDQQIVEAIRGFVYENRAQALGIYGSLQTSKSPAKSKNARLETILKQALTETGTTDMNYRESVNPKAYDDRNYTKFMNSVITEIGNGSEARLVDVVYGNKSMGIAGAEKGSEAKEWHMDTVEGITNYLWSLTDAKRAEKLAYYLGKASEAKSLETHRQSEERMPNMTGLQNGRADAIIASSFNEIETTYQEIAQDAFKRLDNPIDIRESVDTIRLQDFSDTVGGRFKGGIDRILINERVLREKFDDHSWAKERTDGIIPFPYDAFETPAEWIAFTAYHEIGHRFMKESNNPAIADKNTNHDAIENLMNAFAWKKVLNMRANGYDAADFSEAIGIKTENKNPARVWRLNTGMTDSLAVGGLSETALQEADAMASYSLEAMSIKQNGKPISYAELSKVKKYSKKVQGYFNLLKKRRPDLNAREVIDAIATYPTPKSTKLAQHWTLKGALNPATDKEMVMNAIQVAESNGIDPMSFASPAEITTKYTDKTKAKPIKPDTVEEFSNAFKFGNYVTYEVEDNDAGQDAVRKIVDTHIGEDAVPWCLISRNSIAGISEEATLLLDRNDPSYEDAANALEWASEEMGMVGELDDITNVRGYIKDHLEIMKEYEDGYVTGEGFNKLGLELALAAVNSIKSTSADGISSLSRSLWSNAYSGPKKIAFYKGKVTAMFAGGEWYDKKNQMITAEMADIYYEATQMEADQADVSYSLQKVSLEFDNMLMRPTDRAGLELRKKLLHVNRDKRMRMDVLNRKLKALRLTMSKDKVDAEVAMTFATLLREGIDEANWDKLNLSKKTLKKLKKMVAGKDSKKYEKYANEAKTILDELYNNLNKVSREMTGEEFIRFKRENYMPHLYAKKKNTKSDKRTLTSSSQGERKFPTFLEAAEAGYVPLTFEADKIIARYAEMNYSIIAHKSLLKMAATIQGADGDPMIIPRHATDPQMKMPIAFEANTTMFNKFSNNKNDYTKLPSPFIGVQDYWVHPDALNTMKWVLRKGVKGRLGQVLDTVQRVNNWAKFSALGLSFFHPWALNESYISANGGRAAIGLLADVATLGGRVWARKTNWQKYLDATLVEGKESEMAKLGISKGLMLNTSPTYNQSQIELDLQNWIANAQGKRNAPRRGALKLVQMYHHFVKKHLWDSMLPGMKLYTFGRLMDKYDGMAQDKGMAYSRDDVAEQVAAYVNYAFGGIEFERFMAMTPIAKQMLTLGLFAPDWTISNMNIADMGNIGGGKGAIMTNEMKKQYWPWMAFVTMAIPAAVQAGIYGITKGLGADDDDDEAFMLKNEYGNKLTIDVTGIIRLIKPYTDGTFLETDLGLADKERYYMVLGKQAREVGGFFENPLKTLYGKSSMVSRMAFEQITNSSGDWAMDWKGKPFWASTPLRARALAEKFAPMSILSVVKQNRPSTLFAPLRKGMTSYKAEKAVTEILEAYADPTFYNRLVKGGIDGVHIDDLDSFVTDISDALKANTGNAGDPVKRMMTGAERNIKGKYYQKFFEALNKEDYDKMDEYAMSAIRVGAIVDSFNTSMKYKFETRANVEYKRTSRNEVESAVHRAESKVGVARSTSVETRKLIRMMNKTSGGSKHVEDYIWGNYGATKRSY